LIDGSSGYRLQQFVYPVWPGAGREVVASELAETASLVVATGVSGAGATWIAGAVEVAVEILGSADASLGGASVAAGGLAAEPETLPLDGLSPVVVLGALRGTGVVAAWEAGAEGELDGVEVGVAVDVLDVAGVGAVVGAEGAVGVALAAGLGALASVVAPAVALA
jgi:hypothetical protein